MVDLLQYISSNSSGGVAGGVSKQCPPVSI